MIVTVTLNPSLDRTIAVDRLERGAVHRSGAPRIEPGGKGVNVSRALAGNGYATLAIVTAAGPEGAELTRLLDGTGVPTRAVPVNGHTRSNLAIAEPDGTVTKLNEPGSPLDVDELDALHRAISNSVTAGDWVVISGSPTPDLPAGETARLVDTARAAGAFVAVDSCGSALREGVTHRARVIKPNRAELAELVGHELPTLTDVIAGAREARAMGAEIVLATLGADGAVLVAEGVELVGVSPVAHPVSAVGAGDAFLAGFLSAFTGEPDSYESALLEALAWGAAATRLPGSSVPARDDLEPRDVHLVWQPELDRPLLAD